MVVGFAAELLDRGLDALAGYVHTRRIAAGQHAVILLHGRHETLVARRVALGRIPGGRDDADRLVAQALQQGVVHGGPAGQQRDPVLEPEIRVGAHEFHRIGAGEAVEHAVDVGDLRDVAIAAEAPDKAAHQLGLLAQRDFNPRRISAVRRLDGQIPAAQYRVGEARLWRLCVGNRDQQSKQT